jgi:hypothetical protein
MSAGAWVMLLVVAVTVATLAFLITAMARSIRVERAAHRSVWREFALGIILLVLFLVTWVAHAAAQWQTFTDEQLSHGSSPKFGDFLAEFAQATFENWQSEFLQLFSFVVLAALYIHKGSAESKDGEEQIQASLRRLEEHLGTLPPTAPTEAGERWKLPDTSLEAHDRLGTTSGSI